MTTTEFATRLVVAMLAGLVIGLERQLQNKSAGLRTNGLVSTGSAIFVLISISLTQNHGDVTRIIGQVVTGVGFLGGGIIFKEGFNVKGLTTAATVWTSAALGSLAAAGMFAETAIGTAAVIFINAGLSWIDPYIKKEKQQVEEKNTNKN